MNIEPIKNKSDELNIVYASELFSKLPTSAQDQLIGLIKSLLSDDKKA